VYLAFFLHRYIFINPLNQFLKYGKRKIKKQKKEKLPRDLLVKADRLSPKRLQQRNLHNRQLIKFMVMNYCEVYASQFCFTGTILRCNHCGGNVFFARFAFFSA